MATKEHQNQPVYLFPLQLENQNGTWRTVLQTALSPWSNGWMGWTYALCNWKITTDWQCMQKYYHCQYLQMK